MPNLKPLAIALSLSVAFGTAVAADLDAPQLSGGAPSTGLTTTERASGANAKLDDSLIRLKQSSAASLSPARSATASASRQSRSIAPVSYVTVDIVSKGDTAALKSSLESLGFKTSAVYGNAIGGRLPVSAIDQAAKLSGVVTISVPEKHTRAGNVRSQGDFVQHSKLLRDTYTIRPVTAAEPKPPNVSGAGLTIGVISDSFNCNATLNQANANDPDWTVLDTQADDVLSDDLPAGITIVKEADCQSDPGEDEGRAMAQIIHDVAPGANIAFYSPDTMADFAQGITTLSLPTDQVDSNGRHGAGAQIVVDDLGFFAEPLYQEGIIGKAIDDANRLRGVAYFSAAGNAANRGKSAYDNNDVAFAAKAVEKPVGSRTTPLNLGERLLNFDVSGQSTVVNLPVTIGAGSPQRPNGARFAVFWDQPMTGANASSSLDLCLGDTAGNVISKTLCTGPTVVGQPAQKIFTVTNSGAKTAATLRLGLVSGVAPGRVHILLIAGNATIDKYGTDTGSIYGHPLAEKAAAIGATDYFQTPFCNSNLASAKLEPYSSFGGTPFLFDASGVALAHTYTPAKPEFVAPDGVTTTFFGYGSLDAGADTATVADCRSVPDYLNDQFYGTSAAAPHAAAVAALLWEAAPTAKANDLYDALKNSAQDMNTAGFDYASGSGFIQADQALPVLQAALKKAKDKENEKPKAKVESEPESSLGTK